MFLLHDMAHVYGSTLIVLSVSSADCAVCVFLPRAIFWKLRCLESPSTKGQKHGELKLQEPSFTREEHS